MRRIIFIVLTNLLFVLSSNAQDFIIVDEYQSNAKILKKGNKYQLNNEQGDTLLTNLDTAYYYEDSRLFFVKKDGLWGATTISGKIAIPIEFDIIEKYYGWLWEVSRNQKKGLYSISSGVILEPVYDKIEYTGLHGKDFIVKRNNKFGVYEGSGQQIVPVIYDNIYRVLSVMVMSNAGKSAYLIKNKLIADSLDLSRPMEVYGDYASDTKSYYVFIRNGLKGLMNNEGNVIIEPKYQDMVFKLVRDSNNKAQGLFLIKQNDKFGIINVADSIIVPITYENIDLIDSRYAIVGLNNYKYLLNYRTNKLVDDFYFDDFRYISEKHSRVTMDGKVSLLDNSNDYKLIFPFIYDDILSYGKWFVVVQNNRYGLIDEENRIIVPLIYDYVGMSCNYVVAKKDEYFGILSLDNKVVLPFEYSFLSGFSYGFYIRKKDSHKIMTLDCNLKCTENCN